MCILSLTFKLRSHEVICRTLTLIKSIWLSLEFNPKNQLSMKLMGSWWMGMMDISIGYLSINVFNPKKNSNYAINGNKLILSGWCIFHISLDSRIQSKKSICHGMNIKLIDSGWCIFYVTVFRFMNSDLNRSASHRKNGKLILTLMGLMHISPGSFSLFMNSVL